jgi:sugar phosphate isomerase/epimerase
MNLSSSDGSEMRQRACLNTATIKKVPVRQQLRAAFAAGFRRIGLWVDDVEAAQCCGTGLAQISGWIREAGLEVAELCFIGGWQEADESAFPTVLVGAHHICRVAHDLDCDTVVAVPAMGWGLLEAAAARFREICQVAANYGVRIALESPGTAALVNNFATAWKVVSSAGCENGGMVLDAFHFYLGGSNLKDLDRLSAEKIFLVHLSDAMDVSQEKLRTHHDFRTFPGEGTLDYLPLLHKLQEIGYKGAFSLEIWNQRLLEADPMEVAQRGFESLLALEKLASRVEEGLER